jgi:hypothetical protein
LEGIGTRLRTGLFALAVVLHLVTAVGYWLRHDLPWARAAAAQWPAVDQFAATIRSDPRPTAVLAVPVEIRKMLDLAVDRPSTEKFDDPAVRPTIGWLMAPRDHAIPKGFRLQTAAGGYELLKRVQP